VGGTGLGLAIAMEDANLHGGWLTAWGRPAMGAQFRLTLPRKVGAILETSPLPLVPRDLVGPSGTRLDGLEAPASRPPSSPASPSPAPRRAAETTVSPT
jgi:two-component system sensor histidine kinase MtrB